MNESKTLTPARLEKIRRDILRSNEHVYGFEGALELLQHIDALTAEVAAIRDLLRGASGQLKILDRHYPHEAVTELLNQIAAALEKK